MKIMKSGMPESRNGNGTGFAVHRSSSYCCLPAFLMAVLFGVCSGEELSGTYGPTGIYAARPAESASTQQNQPSPPVAAHRPGATHSHRCPNCGNVWEHGPEAANSVAAHTCSKCGAYVVEKYQAFPGNAGPIHVATPAKPAAADAPRFEWRIVGCERGRCRKILVRVN